MRIRKVPSSIQNKGNNIINSRPFSTPDNPPPLSTYKLGFPLSSERKHSRNFVRKKIRDNFAKNWKNLAFFSRNFAFICFTKKFKIFVEQKIRNFPEKMTIFASFREIIAFSVFFEFFLETLLHTLPFPCVVH